MSEPVVRVHAASAPTPLEVLSARAAAHPEQEAFRFLAEGDQTTSLTYGELWRRARALGAWLALHGARDERALLLYPPGLDFVTAFFGCLAGGAVAVPSYPPNLNRPQQRLRSIAENARPRFVLTTTAILGRAEALATQVPELAAARWLATDELPPGLEDEWKDPGTDPDSLAFLQYTSGSTAAPKGVMVSHRNLGVNEEMIHKAFEQSERSVVVGWLPLFHDMGLIGSVLQPLYVGGRCILMSPVSFLQRPARWLRAISEHRATTSGGPDFAYDLCVRRVTAEQKAALDLSSWTVAFNGAEPVRAETLDRFAEAFAECGFRREAFYPCYGLAEATLFVSGGERRLPPSIRAFDAAALEGHRAVPADPADSDIAGARRLVSNGRSWLDGRVVIADPETAARRSDGQVGEIWVAGPSVAHGYWNRPEETEATFRGFLADTGEGPFLRTGDLGFLEDGELFVTGRIKDLIILRGRNHYPQDIERSAEQSHGALRPGCGAAFSVPGESEERLVVVQEVAAHALARTDLAEVATAIRREVSGQHDVTPWEVVLIRAGTIPKTSSGKIQRSACRAAWRAGELTVLWTSGAPVETVEAETETLRPGREALRFLPPDERAPLLETFLAERVAARLAVPAAALDLQLPLSALGLDSLGAAELKNEIEDGMGVRLRSALLITPTLAELAREVAEQLAAEPGADDQTLTAGLAGPVSVASEHPLSYGQEGLWFLHGLAPESAAYHIGRAARTRGAVDADALRAALAALAERHAALRVTFAIGSDGPVQQVAVEGAGEIGLRVEDAAGWPEAAVAGRVDAEIARPFNLAAGPLARLLLLRGAAAPGDVLVLVVHHIAADLGSLSVLLDELGRLYAEATGGPAARLEPLAVSYFDFVAWQRRRLAGLEGDRLWSYWRRQLAGELPVLDLPADRPRPPAQTFGGVARTLRLDSGLAAALRTQARREGATLSMVLLAAFAALLHRSSGQDDLLIGLPTAGRSARPLEGVVGYFVNPVAVRSGLAGRPAFRRFLGQVRGTTLAALEHAEYPFLLLAERLQPVRDPSRSPVFQAMFVHLRVRRDGQEALPSFALDGVDGVLEGVLEVGGLGLSPYPVETRAAQFDLTLEAAETGAPTESDIALRLVANADLFDGATAARLLGHLRTLLGALTADPSSLGTAVADLPLLTAAEHDQIVAWGTAPAVEPPEQCLHEMFAAQAARTPDAVALMAREQEITYAELADRASRLAEQLVRLGVGPEVPVGICAGRTPDMVAGLLAVLSAGGAYVPLDPAYPEERLAFMLEDSRAAALLAGPEVAGRLPVTELPVLPLDLNVGRPARSSRPRLRPGPDNLAYLIYTSGSSGRPKAVAIAHRSAAVLVRWAERTFSREELSGVLAATSICFDLSVFELFVPLCLGGRVILAENALELPALAARDQVRLVNTVPSAATELARSGGLPASAGTVNLAGEPLQRTLVRDLYASGGVRRVINLYGPSEDTTYSTIAVQEPDAEGTPPIGRPVDGTRLHLLDAAGQRVPVGVPGEIFLAGDGLARGYHGRPELTAERFVPDPFATAPGERLYQTGDLARLRPLGELEYLGRADQQVKIRGFRIESGEVEAALLREPAVRDAAVQALPDGTGRRLVAWVVPMTDGLDAEALRDSLRRHLPEHMIPAAFVTLEALPLLPNGKVDRRALPAPRDAAAARTVAYVAPRTPLEELLCGVWAEVLGVERVGILDHFFELGGHSLLAARVVSRLRERLALEVPFRLLFEAPTVAALAREAERTLGRRRAAAAPPVVPTPREGALPLSFAQQRLWFLDRLAPGSSAYNMPAALRLGEDFDEPALVRALGEVVRRHEALRTTFREIEGRPVQVIAPPPGDHPLPAVDLTALPAAAREAEARRLAGEEARRPFDLEREPLLRATVLRLGAAGRLLLLTLHHIASDGWSMRVLARELAALYTAFTEGAPSPLPELPVQYADFALWQRGWLQGEVLEAQLGYWRRTLRDLPPPLELPSARPRGTAAGSRGEVCRLHLPASLARRLGELGRREGATPFITLLAAFQVLLGRSTGQTSFCVGTPVAGRNRAETEGLIGLFLNTLPLRADLAGDPPFRELLARVREACLGAFAHQDVPFERLLEELRPDRDLESTPLFQVLFNLLSAETGGGGAVELFGQEIRPFGIAGLDVKLDLTLYAAERADGLEIELHYNSGLFDAVQMERMAGHLRTLLAGIAVNPGRRISELPLAKAEERAARHRADAPEEAGSIAGSIIDCFARIAREHAGRPAVATAGHRWTYRDLDRLSDRVARGLLAAGGAPGERVALLFAHDAPMVAGVLAALKAGATYVPLDPFYPRRRLATMLADAGAVSILTDAANLPLARELGGDGLRILEISQAAAEGDRLDRLPLPEVPAEAAAYILYTSGSTGEPKGVTQSHRNVLRHIRAYTGALRIVPADRLALFASYSFDAAVMDLFGALLNGAALCPWSVREQGTHPIPAWLAREEITIFHSTPTLYRRFVETLEGGEDLSSVRLVVLGGERTLAQDLEQFGRLFPPGALFVNGLGPTECTLALQFFATGAEAAERATVPVGHPVQGVEVSLVTVVGEQDAVYGIGEIVLRSPALALGYWRRPGLTAAAFQPAVSDEEGNDGAEAGARAYRTGDLGRWLPDGGIEFVGRNDAQVKIRGHRVETGEVENRLSALPGVGQAVVVAREGEGGEPRLIAYWLAASDPPPGRAELAGALRQQLPEFMIPEDFVLLDHWPLTPTGKVDRAALPAPESRQSARSGEEGAAPRTPLQELLAGLWSEVLRVDRVGIADGFFELGGHSLIATQLVARIRRVLGLEIPLRLIFEAPTVAALAERIEAGFRGDAAPTRPALLPADRTAPLPLSFGQQRFWFIDQLEPGSAAYSMVAALRLTGRLDAAALAGAFGDLVRRHEALRTTFAATLGEPVQVIAPPAPGPLPMPVLDLSGLPTERRPSETEGLARALAALPFDLAAGPLLRVTLLRVEPEEHLAVVAMHHIVSDGWSLEVLAREVAALYQARSEGLPPSLPELPLQYADFAAWQRRWLEGEGLAAHLAYWRERLRGLPPRLALPTDRPRPAVASHQGGSLPVAVPAALARELGLLAARQGSTLFMVLLAAFQTLLGRWTGEEDLAVGTPIAGRTRIETEELIGLFVNTLVLRGDLSGHPAFGELLRRVRATSLEAHAHQDLPFERLVEELQPERSLNASPLFQVMLTLQNTRRGALVLPGLAVEALPLATGQVKLDLSLTLTETAEGLAGTLEYAADLFDAITAARLAGHLETLLAALGAPDAPSRRIADLPLLRPEERHQLLVEWSDTATGAEPGLCLHHLVEARMALDPGALAVIADDDLLTYGELDRRSAWLAARLAAAGIGRGSFVPVLIDHGVELVIALLAVLRAGAAFVPLDPEWPAERLAGILEEVGCPVVLAGSDASESALPGRTLLRVGRETLDGAPSIPRHQGEPGEPIYAIYTSGSTGLPKGVVVPHRGIVNRFLWMDRFFGDEAARVVLQTTRSIYDSAVWQILWPLTRGGATVLTDPRRGSAPEYLLGLVERHRVTMADFVPSVFQVVVEQLREGGAAETGFESLRAVVVGGEEMEPTSAETFRRLLPAVTLVNLYGPTEASIGCICHPVREAPRGRVPIGRPIDNVAALVLDPAGNPVPVGVHGELYLAGRCVGTGYLGDEEKTRRAFVVHPDFGRMYRTGDRARWLPDGTLDFLGRLDHQIKIRGLRVEPGEIEAALRRDPRVTQAAVLALGDQLGGRPGDRRLVAFVATEGATPCTAAELRQGLLGVLPAPLVPASFVFLETLPVSPGGKVDRRELARLADLAAPDTTPAAEEGDRAFASPHEEILAGIWTEVLRPAAPVGPGDDFFALGGHSLLATRVTSRVRRAFGVEIPLRSLFEEPTLAGLARRIAAELGRGLAVPPLAPVPRTGDLPLSFAQQRLWFLESLQPGSALYNLPLTVRLDGALDAGLLARALSAVVRRHESLRTTFPMRDGQPVQAIAEPGPVPLPVVDQRGLPDGVREAESRRRLVAEARRPFDLARGPLLRALLLRLDETAHLLLVNVHHTVCDGWSIGLLESELAAVYEALAAGSPAALPELPVQVADHAAWQRQLLTGETLERELAFWRERLQEFPPVLDLPADRPRPAVQTFRGAHLPVILPAELTEGLAAFSQARGATLFMTLLAGLDALLWRISGEERLAVGTPVANRGAVEIEGLIGNFANTLVVPVSLGGDLGFDAVLERVREATLASLAHQELPFELLVEALSPRRDLSANPIFQVLFGLHRLPPRGHRLGEVALTPVPFETGTARFDLALDLQTAPDGVRGSFEYSTDLFDRATLERLVGHWRTLLAGALEAPGTPLAELPLLTPEERSQLAAWNETAVAHPEEGALLHELVAAQARRTPDAVAVSMGEEELTYRELAARAETLAGWLRAQGVGPDLLVGLCAERSPTMLVGLFGILAAGGAYVPLDPAFPAERLAAMIQDADLPLLLTERVLADRLPAHRARVVLLDGAPEAPALLGNHRSGDHPAAGADALAYVLFTSGSTGRPKGVQISHRALVNLLLSMRRAPGLTADDTLLAVTTLSFDIAGLELFLPLLTGARVALADRETASDGRRLIACLEQTGATVLQATPATWLLLLDAGWSGDRRLKALCGGEALPADLAGRLRERVGELWNVYGPTETTIWSAARRVEPGEAPVRVGGPVASTGLHVVGLRGEPVPVGVRGELLIGGAGLARGYLGQPDLTAERFVPDPFAERPGARLYRTGDLVRRRADGTFEFLGRIDHQVKVRGFRIELGEIEATLARHPSVSAAAVLAPEGRTGRRLVAYVVAEEADAAGLRGWVRERLPEYMVPATVVVLPALPLSPNGKVDRKALARIEPETAAAEGWVAPRTPVEEILAEVWAEVLGVGRVGIHDDFFDLGGHSLLATRLLARVQQALRVELSLRALFEDSTVAALAARIEREREGGSQDVPLTSLLRIAPEERDLPFPLTDIQQAYWVGRLGALELGNVGSHRYFEIEGDLDPERFERVWRMLIDRHDMLRAVFLPDGTQRILPEVPPYRLAVQDLRGLPAAEAERRLEASRAEMSHQVLPTDRWPLFDLRAFRLDGGRTRVCLSFDYLISDAWSNRLLAHELQRLYREPDPAPLPPLELSFRDYVLAERALRETPRYQRALEYWRGRLADLPPGPELPLAKSPGSLEHPVFHRRKAVVPAEAWERLKARGQRGGITPSALLLTVFAEALGAWSKAPRFRLVLTLFNRLPFHPEVNALVGDFTSTVLLVFERSATEPFEPRARRVQEQLWSDLDHRYVSGVEVTRELARQQGESARAATSVVFTSTLALGDLGGEPERPLAEVVYSISQTPQVVLDYQLTEHEGRLEFNWDAVDELFPAGVLDDMFAAHLELLDRLAGDPDAWERPLPTPLPPSQLALRAEVNATAALVPEGLLHEPFLETARRAPDRLAVIAPERRLPYGELLRLADATALRLRQAGVRPNTLVAVAMEKGWEQVVGVLAVLRAGAAYLPVDANLPAERFAFLLEHGEVAVALTQPWLADRLAWPAGVERVVIDGTGGFTDEMPLAPVQAPEDLAYVIFTSGSTGLPKGVMIDHRGALNTVVDVNQRFGIGPEDRVLALSALNFDLSVYDVFGLLAVGGAVVFPEATASRDPERWAELLRRERVTVWNTVPALMDMLVTHLEGRSEKLPASLRLVMMSGDWIPLDLPGRIRERAHDASDLRVISLGGATEASIWSILYPIERCEPEWRSVPYGRPMVNQTFHVLDEALEPRPVWVPGELYIGGIGVALGYWRDPEKTAARFLVHPRTGERLYRTGDLGRYLPDGNIEFLGREDFQVKIQGYRIELGEIEWALGQHPEVRACAVAAVGEARAARRLVAYVVAEGGDRPGLVMELREHLAASLPAYMVPSSFVFLGSLPLSATGKVDRKALPAPGALPEAEAPAASPSGGAVGGEIARIVSGVLQAEVTDAEANLFDLGANSVDLIRIANQLERDLGFRPKLEDFFRTPTVAALERLRGGVAKPAGEAPPAGQPAVASRWTPAEPVLDPNERERFKARRPGLRPDAAGRPGVALPDSRPPAARFLELHSERDFDPAPIPLARFGGLLSCLGEREHEGHPKQLYPSAGGLYPVQTYVYVKPGRVEGLPGGVYYHFPPEHRLIPLVEGAELDRSIYGFLVNRPIFDRAAFAIFFIAQAEAIAPLYTRQGRDFCLIEAGCMLQLLRSTAPEHGLAICPVGTLEFETVRPLFGLGEGHELMHSLLGGIPVSGASAERPRSELAELDGAQPEANPGTAEPPLVPIPREGELPLSSPQLRLWILDQLEPGNPAYNVVGTVRISGDLDAVTLAGAMSEIRRRHEVLRTTFPEAGGRPCLAIAPPEPVVLPRVSLRGLPPEAREAEASRLAAAEASQPFDLARGPLLRNTLVELAADEHLVLFTLHHIISDVWSLGILMSEMVPLYGAFREGRPSPLPELPVQYVDFASWQQEWLRGAVLEEQLAYWRRQLGGAPPVLALPTRRERSQAIGNQGAQRFFSLDAALTRQIQRLARRVDGTLFITLLAAFQTLLHVLSGQDDIVVGTPITNRRRAETERLIGFFVSTLVMRTGLAGDPTFLEVLERVRGVVLGAFAHQDVPFEQVVDALRPDRSLDRAPLFQVWFVLQNAPVPALELPGLRVQAVDVHSGAVRHDLKLDLQEIGEGMRGSFEYKTELFDEETIAGFCADLERLLALVTERPEIRLGEVREALASAAAARREAQEQQLRDSRRQGLRGLRELRRGGRDRGVPRTGPGEE